MTLFFWDDKQLLPGKCRNFSTSTAERGEVFKGKMFRGNLEAAGPLHLESFNHHLITWRAEPRERNEGHNWGGEAEQNSWGEICHAPLGAA